MAALRALRHLVPSQKTLFLTFDDGPDPTTTPAVLDLLAQYKAHATFFVIARAAVREAGLVKRLLAAGHSLGNHSLDHSYRPFFQSQKKLGTWIKTSDGLLQDLSGGPTVGFRPPAGVVTPPLLKVLAGLGEPLVLWNTRFYDALWTWRPRAAKASLERARAGDIVLLHDHQRTINRAGFLRTLEIYLQGARRQGFVLEALSRELTVPQNPVA